VRTVLEQLGVERDVVALWRASGKLEAGSHVRGGSATTDRTHR